MIYINSDKFVKFLGYKSLRLFILLVDVVDISFIMTEISS